MLATDSKKHILIVDREVAASEPLRQRLLEEGFTVSTIADAEAAIATVAQRPPHLVILDWNVAGTVAPDFIHDIRTAHASQIVRIIILSALADEHAVVAGLNMGADDYIAKPFSMREVVARVCTVLRKRSCDTPPTTLTCDALVLEVASNRVTAGGRLIKLRGIEYRLLEFLMTHRGRTFNRAQLLAHVWGDDADVDERTVDVNVQRLRRILSESGCEAYVQTVRGFGYRFATPALAASGP